MGEESIDRVRGGGAQLVEQRSQSTQTFNVTLRRPTAFHCIPLVLFQPGAFLTGPAEGALHSDQALWESSGAFMVDIPRVG